MNLTVIMVDGQRQLFLYLHQFLCFARYQEFYHYEYDKKKILFVGKKYYPNLIGFKWFVDNVLPSLTDNIQVDVVGRGLEELRNEYSDSRINVIGGVESLNPYYENADIVIAPLFDGGGMKSKTVEALSFGKIFVGTEESLFGFWEEMDSDIRGKTCYQCNTPEEWIQTINNLEMMTFTNLMKLSLNFSRQSSLMMSLEIR